MHERYKVWEHQIISDEVARRYPGMEGETVYELIDTETGTAVPFSRHRDSGRAADHAHQLNEKSAS